MYVAVKGGEKAIRNAHALMARKRRGDTAVPEVDVDQIREQLSLAVDRVMAEGSLYDRDLAALAVKQARGDLVEAVFLLRAYRTTLPRFGSSQPVDTASMHVRRRISATYKDVPGGQALGPTFDYTHRLLDAALATPSAVPSGTEESPEAARNEEAAPFTGVCPKVLAFLEKEGLLPPEDSTDVPPGDLTRQALLLPASRDIRLQNLARADEGLLLALAYSTQRGFGATHPFAGEIRMGEVEVFFTPEELGFPVIVGEVTLTECESVNQFTGGRGRPASFTRGYGLAFGENERKAISMAMVDRALRSGEFDEEVRGPAQNAEFVLCHSDNVEASGFVQHVKLPHYVDFQAELALVRALRAKAGKEDSDDAPSA
ncbi:MAG: carbon-phosphorus lyase complex subunit PhnI [Deltaproteobacteria bacterium]|jgi:alpha-D-ribose 1-methylphosphonate 5-triphosphate synthase subunit PhnI|nr:carbon-phosphorus lyase complex subunit PhnI [Deltaproteobacteria bacterium]